MRTRIENYANAPVLTREETGRYDLAWKDLQCSECSVNSNELSKV